SAGTLVFDYTVASDDHTADLQATQVNLNGATVKDGYGVDVDFSLATNEPTGLSINSPLAVVGVSTAASMAHAGETVALTLSMTEAFTVSFGAPTLTLSNGG